VYSVTNNKMPLVSIGIPTYNRPEELRRILRQMVDQTYINTEIIILDNCSSMPEVELVVKEFIAKYSKVKYVKNESNLGVLRNAAELINYANGEYFCWVSDDDYRSIDFIERTVSCLQNAKDIAGVFCDFREVDSEGRQYPGYPLNHSKLMWFFSSKYKVFRRLMYYFSSAACGKCNVFYSLFRTGEIKNLKFSELSDSFTALNMDCMIVYQMLALSPIQILDFVGCQLTIGNKKNYQGSSSINTRSAINKLLNLVNELNKDRKRYCKFSDPLEVFVITLVFPIKVVAEVVRVTFRVKCYSLFAKRARKDFSSTVMNTNSRL